MTANKYKGEEKLKIGGVGATIVFDWNALGKLQTELSGTEIDAVVNGRDLGKIALVLSIGLEKHNPEFTVDKIVEASPPFALTVEALKNAITYAYFGGEDPADSAKAAPKKKAASRKKKK